MVEIYFSYHMRDPIGYGGVAIPIHKNDGTLFKPTTTILPSDFKRAVFKFENGGTGFLISISEIQINGIAKKLGLLLTAAHVVLDLKEGQRKNHVFPCRLLEKYREKAYLLNEFASCTTFDHLCSTTNFLYCMPGDVAILLVTLDNCKSPEYFEPLDHSSIISHMKCFISGFPKTVRNLEYYIPNKNLSDIQANDIANKIFNNFSGMVHSHGLVINENDTLVEISCSATNGMSGSPIVCQGKYIGVYVGGPALPGQKELVDSMKLAVAGDYNQAYNILKSTVCYDRFYEHTTFSYFLKDHESIFTDLCAKDRLKIELSVHEKKKIKKLKKNTQLKEFEIQRFLELSSLFLHMLICVYKDKLNFSANLGISYKNKVFRQVDLYVQKFSTCNAQSFLCIDDIISFLNL